MQFKDQLNQTITINQPPKRIISLVPSQTELLFDLGLTDEIIGITKFCIHPKDKFKTTAKIGGTKKLNLQKIIDLKPDLIIGNKEENQKEDIEALMQLFPVWMSDIYNLEDALEMIKNVGELVNRKDEALKIAQETQANFNQLIKETSNIPKKKALYFIWKDPYMLAGKQTFINEMLGYCNLENIITQSRYPSIEKIDFTKFNPEVVFLSSEPFPFKEKHIKYFSHI
jgi:ABC-type Fe3+-hydroxamate transport system substrate-binding protein